MVFPKEADAYKLFFNMMNENTNGFAGLISWMRFYRFSALYLEIDSMVKSRVSYDVIKRIRKPLTLQSICEPDVFLYNQLIDFLALHFDFFVNFKQFMEWFFLDNVFSLLRNAANKYHTGLDRLLSGF